MKPDISKIVVGSRVTFEVTKMDVDRLNDSQVMLVGIEQIISIEPPAFDWSSVRPGMAFRWEGNDEICHYIGRDFKGFYVFSAPWDKGVPYQGWSSPEQEFTRAPKSDLTPAPEDEG